MTKMTSRAIRLLYQNVFRPLLFMVDAETTHNIALTCLRCQAKLPWLNEQVIKPIFHYNIDRPDGRLIQNYFDLIFPNPIGLAAGFDKNALAPSAIEALGFGFVEIGTVTSLPQEGNPRARLFRLPQYKALINKMGFNGDGKDRVAKRLSNTPKINVPLGINIGKSKIVPNEEAVEDYLATFRALARYADYIVVNVSSPNTANLRELQERGPLSVILKALREEARKMGLEKLPILVKIAPDLSLEQIDIVMEVVRETDIQGIIAVNTTISREDLPIGYYQEGGLSGEPLKRLARIALGHIKKQDPEMFVISCGGIDSAEEARERFILGANLLQGYTGLVYKGPTYALDINSGLLELARREGLFRMDKWFNLVGWSNS